MKRFVFWFMMALIGAGWIASHHRPGPPPGRQRVVYRSADGTLQTFQVGRHDTLVLASAPGKPDLLRVERRDGRVVDLSTDHVRLALGRDNDDEFGDDERVSVEGLPVQVVPGSRVTEAKIEPPKPVPPRVPQTPRRPRRPRPPAPPMPPASAVNHAADVTTIIGRLSATEPRAIDDAARQLREKLAEQIRPRVPVGWKIPDRLIAEIMNPALVSLRQVPRDYGTMYEATIKIDHWTQKQVRVIQVYRQEVVRKHLLIFGGALAFVLVCLAALSGYIKADEATKGYYTNKLRIAAAAGVGAAGVVLYEWLKS